MDGERPPTGEFQSAGSRAAGVPKGAWRRGLFREVDDSRRGDDRIEAVVRRVGPIFLQPPRWRRDTSRPRVWFAACGMFLLGVWAAASFLFPQGERVRISHLGWTKWGVLGLVLGTGAWMAAGALPESRWRAALRWLGFELAAAPLVLHLAGLI